MKKQVIIITIFIFLSNLGYSQNNGWMTIQDNEFGIEFSTPEPPIIYDTLNTKLYAIVVDSLLALQVHIFNNARFNTSDPVFNDAINREQGDTLRTIAKLILLASNSEITEIQEVQTDSVNGLEIGITYKTLASNVPYHTFIKYYIYNGRFISFTVTGAEDDLQRVLNIKNIFFNSIKIN